MAGEQLMSYVTGVDVSSYQVSDFDTSGLAFAIVKATESTDYTNPNYSAQVAHARAGGLVVGHYHFARSTDSAAEVAYFASVAEIEASDIIALDWEESSVTPAARDAWLADVKARFPRNRVVLYCDAEFWTELDPTHSCGDGLWIADYNGGSKPDITQPWVFWQYSSANGIDHDYGNFTSLTALVDWCLGLPPAAPTTEDEDFMSATSVNGRAGLAWPTGRCHSIGVNYDNTAPNCRVVMCLHTGPLVVTESWVPKNGCDAMELPAAHVADCQGVILESSNGATYDVTAS
jgi:hypothetical protein